MRLAIPMLALATIAFPAHPFERGEVLADYRGAPVVRILAPGAIPAIDEPRFVRGKAADRQMRDDEPVLGVALDGVTRAYSLWQLDTHEIVNDRIRGTAIAVTW